MSNRFLISQTFLAIEEKNFCFLFNFFFLLSDVKGCKLMLTQSNYRYFLKNLSWKKRKRQKCFCLQPWGSCRKCFVETQRWRNETNYVCCEKDVEERKAKQSQWMNLSLFISWGRKEGSHLRRHITLKLFKNSFKTK